MTVRYVEQHRRVRVVIEGHLPASFVSSLIDDACAKLSRADGAPYVAHSLDDPPTGSGAG